MWVAELLVVLVFIWLGARLGSIGIGFSGGFGVLVLGLVFGIKPGAIPVDVILIIMGKIIVGQRNDRFGLGQQPPRIDAQVILIGHISHLTVKTIRQPPLQSPGGVGQPFCPGDTAGFKSELTGQTFDIFCQLRSIHPQTTGLLLPHNPPLSCRIVDCGRKVKPGDKSH